MALENSIKEQVLSVLGDLSNDVEISLVVGSENEKECEEVLDLLNDVKEVVPQLSVTKYDVNDAFAKENHIENTPALKIHAKGTKSSYTYFGSPSMYEFSSLIEAIRTVGNRKTDLSDQVVSEIKAISKPVNVEIFVTPSCSYCPSMVIAGFRMAYENPNVIVNVIEATSFRSKMVAKGIRSVPKTFINESSTIDGSVPIDEFVAKVKSAQ